MTDRVPTYISDLWKQYHTISYSWELLSGDGSRRKPIYGPLRWHFRLLRWLVAKPLIRSVRWARSRKLIEAEPCYECGGGNLTPTRHTKRIAGWADND